MKTGSLVKPPESRTLKSGRVILSPGEEVGRHMTSRREEILIVLRGTATLIQGNSTITLKEKETHYIPPEKEHNVINDSDEELEYIYAVSLFE